MSTTRSPLTWLGGKGQLLRQLLPLFPPHETYVEPFAGGAALFFAKAPSPVEILNDANGDLMNFYRVLRDRKLFAEFRRLVPAEVGGTRQASRCAAGAGRTGAATVRDDRRDGAAAVPGGLGAMNKTPEWMPCDLAVSGGELMARIDHYENRHNGTTFVCSGCGDEFEPYGALILSSSERGCVFGNDQQVFNPDHYGQPYRPNRELRRWLEQHAQCEQRPERVEVVRGVRVIDRRRVR